MAKFIWEDGTLVSKAKVEIDGTIYEVDPEEYSGTTPLSANNLNAMLDDIYDELFYKSGDIFEIASGYSTFVGYITGSGSSLRFSIPLPKQTKNISSFSVNSLTLTARVPSGGYIIGASTDFLTNSNTRSISTYISQHVITIVIDGVNAWTNAVNNTPISVVTNSLSVTFN